MQKREVLLERSEGNNFAQYWEWRVEKWVVEYFRTSMNWKIIIFYLIFVNCWFLDFYKMGRGGLSLSTPSLCLRVKDKNCKKLCDLDISWWASSTRVNFFRYKYTGCPKKIQNMFFLKKSNEGVCSDFIHWWYALKWLFWIVNIVDDSVVRQPIIKNSKKAKL